jgi:hypothetical protein
MDPSNLTESQQLEKDGMPTKRQIKADKAEIARVKKCQYTAEYQKEYKEWVDNYQKDRYNTNSEYRKQKGLQGAYSRYLKGANVSNRLVDELKEAGYGHLPYRKESILVIISYYFFVIIFIIIYIAI